MKKEIIQKLHASFEDVAREQDGVEFWLARDLQILLGYDEWRNFTKVIDKAKEACGNAGVAVEDQFVDFNKLITHGKGGQRSISDFMLTRYACYLIAQNGDPSKEPIAFAQTYFAVQTRKQELIEERLQLMERLQAREKLEATESQRIKKPRNFRCEAVPSPGYVTVVAQRIRGLTGYHGAKISNINLISKMKMKKVLVIPLRKEVNIMLKEINNLKISQSFHPILGTFEVILRNRFDEELTKHFGDKDWTLNKKHLLPRSMVQDIQTVESRLIKKGGVLTHGKIIADQNLSFWTEQFEKTNFKKLGGSPIQAFRLLPTKF